MKKTTRNVKGFTLVELLAVVVIIGILAGIGITSVSRLINNAKSQKNSAQHSTVVMAMESYLQSNKNLYPKSIGESTNVPLSYLKDSNYIKDDIVNDKGESCTGKDQSYVKIYKLSKTEYTYTTFMYCGTEKAPNTETSYNPIITGYFSDKNRKEDKEALQHVSTARLIFNIAAVDENDTGAKQLLENGNDIYITGYSFKLNAVTCDSEVKNCTDKEVYNSGSLSANNEFSVPIDKALKDYIDVTDVNILDMVITAYNNLGGSSTATFSTRNLNGEYAGYKDTTKPICKEYELTVGEHQTVDGWYNKETFARDGYRQLFVNCDDGEGSDCIRPKFSKSWPNDDEPKGAEDSHLVITDNAGNEQECSYAVKVDLESPSATMTAYNNSGYKNSNVITEGEINVSDTFPTYSLSSNKYKNIVNMSNPDGDLWMNKQNYSDGVFYEVKVSDNIHLKKWTWNTNAADLNGSTYSSSVSSTNPDAASGEFNFENERYNATIRFSFKKEGKRFGVLTIYDAADNVVTINVAANLDRTCPPNIPNELNLTNASGVETNFSDWKNSNSAITVKTNVGLNYDFDPMSGFWQFFYDAKNHAKQSVGTSPYGTSKTDSSGTYGTYTFSGTAAQIDGKNYIKFKSCDIANNCTDYGTERQVWIDTTPPTCSVSKNAPGENGDGWSGIGETVTVIASCSDNDAGTKGSGCKDAYSNSVSNFTHSDSSFSYLYNVEIKTNAAGAAGVNKPGTFNDYAGNSVDCATSDSGGGYEKVWIDYHAPTCTTSGGSKPWRNTNLTIYGTCHDTGGSECRNNIEYTFTSNKDTKNGGPGPNGGQGIVKDKADNEGTCYANQEVHIDKTPPTCTSSGGSSAWTNGSRTITGTCADEGGSGCAKTSISHPYNSEIDTKTAGPAGNNNGGTLYDVAGNSVTCPTNQEVHIDQTPPTCSVGGQNSNWRNSAVTLTLNCSDEGGSGCQKSEYANSGAICNEKTRNFPSSNVTIYDNANNSTVCVPSLSNVYCDNVAPTGSCSISKYSISANPDSDLSGISSTKYAYGNSKGSFHSSSGTTSDCDDSETTIYGWVRFEDVAGNTSEDIGCSGSYKLESCAHWVTSCRNGKTFIFNDSRGHDGSPYAGTVYKQVGVGYDKLWEQYSSGSLTYIKAESATWYSLATGIPYAWIYSNCIGGYNTACPYSECPE